MQASRLLNLFPAVFLIWAAAWLFGHARAAIAELGTVWWTAAPLFFLIGCLAGVGLFYIRQAFR